MIKDVTREIITGEKTSLSQMEAREIFDEIFQGLSDEISTSAFITAFQTLNNSEEIIQAVIEASMDSIIKPSHSFNNLFQTVNLAPCEKYFDIFFALDVINSANNVTTVKYSVSKPNKNPLFKKFAADKETYDEDFMDKIEKTNFCYYYLNGSEKYIKYTRDIRANLEFCNIFDLADYFLNPFSVKNQFVGVKNSVDVQKTAKLALLLKYENSLVLTSSHGLPYAVLDGENTVAEAWKNKIFTYVLTPELLDLPEYSIDLLKVENDQDSFKIIENVFNNKVKDVYYYTIVLNAALMLYISKTANSLTDGINLAQKTIDSGIAKEKLKQIICNFT